MELRSCIDHTVLKPEATAEMIHKLCQEAAEQRFKAVCVNPGWVALCKKLLTGTQVSVCTVVGFPLGATTTASKAFEAREAIANGATEIDMVLAVGALKSKDEARVLEDIRAVVGECRGRALVKVILETCLLTRDEIVKACQLSKKAGADFVKTSTGFSSGGATAEQVALMRATVGPDMGVKASGGIRDRKIAEQMIEAGANRLGTSASIAIVTG